MMGLILLPVETFLVYPVFYLVSYFLVYFTCLFLLVTVYYLVKNRRQLYYRFFFRPKFPLVFAFGKEKGVGKTTLARMLRKRYGGIEINNADPLKQICMTLFDLTFDQVNDEVEKEKIIPRLGLSPRTIMQRMGTEFGREFFPKLFPEIPLYRENIWLTIYRKKVSAYQQRGGTFVW